MEDILTLLIPLAPFLIAGFAIWTGHQRRMAKLQIEANSEQAAQYAARGRDLEERVRVLERIVTDRGYDLAGQIEALREPHLVEAREGTRPS